MEFLHADADSHCIYGMQRYGPTERAVALWGHEIACLWPFGDMKHDMKLLTLLPFYVLCTLASYTFELDQHPRLFSPTGLHVRSCLVDRSGLQVVSPVLSPSSLLNRDTEVSWRKRKRRRRTSSDNGAKRF